MAIDKTIPLVVHVFNHGKVGKPVLSGEGCSPLIRLVEPEESPGRVKMLGAFETRFLFNPNDVSEWRLAGRERQMTVPGSSSWADRTVMHRAERFRDRRTVDGRKDGWSIASDCWKRFLNW
jgi:hypothetical protein